MIAFLRSYGWAFCSGILLAWALPAFHWYPLAWIGLVPLLRRTAVQAPGAAAAQFLAAGWVFHTIVLQWLMANIFWAAGWAVVGQQGLCLFLSLYWALLGAIWAWLNQRWPDSRAVWLFALCWMSMEWLQARLFTGFGWGALGYSQGPDVWFAQLASVGGVVLLSGILVLVNGFLARALCAAHSKWKPALAAVAVVGVAHGAGLALYGPDQRGESDFAVGLYQSNYSQHMKWDPDFQQEMLEMALLQSHAVAAAEPVQLFVWPEALVMDDYREIGVLEQLESFVTVTGAPLYAGAVRRESRDLFNSSVLVKPDGSLEAYDKIHLAPFGEYIPLDRYLAFLQNFGAARGIAAGSEHRVLEAGGRRFGPLICFEVLFSPLASKRRAMGADFLVVVTNLAWFGGSNVLSQELEIARFRAIENRLPLVQCANTGVSGVFDPYGRLSVIDGYVGSRGYITWRSGAPTPADAMVQRRVGALPVAPAGHMLIPGSVDWIGRVVPLLSLAGLLIAARPRRARQEPETEAAA